LVRLLLALQVEEVALDGEEAAPVDMVDLGVAAAQVALA